MPIHDPVAQWIERQISGRGKQIVTEVQSIKNCETAI